MQVTDVGATHLRFTWNQSTDFHTWSMASCSNTAYNIIIASNCGTCPTTTRNQTAECIDFVANGTVCTFAIQEVVCGNMSGPVSNTVNVTLQGKL